MSRFWFLKHGANMMIENWKRGVSCSKTKTRGIKNCNIFKKDSSRLRPFLIMKTSLYGVRKERSVVHECNNPGYETRYWEGPEGERPLAKLSACFVKRRKNVCISVCKRICENILTTRVYSLPHMDYSSYSLPSLFQTSISIGYQRYTYNVCFCS